MPQYDPTCPACRSGKNPVVGSDYRNYCRFHLKALVATLTNENEKKDRRLRNYELEVVGHRGY